MDPLVGIFGCRVGARRRRSQVQPRSTQQHPRHSPLGLIREKLPAVSHCPIDCPAALQHKRQQWQQEWLQQLQQKAVAGPPQQIPQVLREAIPPVT